MTECTNNMTAPYLLLSILTIVLYPGQCMDVHVCRYYNLPICLAMVVTGLVAAFPAFREFYTRDGILSFIGKNTLVMWALLRVISCLECTDVSIVLNRWMPLLVGKTGR